MCKKWSGFKILFQHIPFCQQNIFLVENFFALGAQENNALVRVPITHELLFSKLLRDVPEMNVCSTKSFLHLFIGGEVRFSTFCD